MKEGPVYVQRNEVIAYERRTGFYGIGEFLVRKGLIVIVGDADHEE